jgi:hypothetical protein
MNLGRLLQLINWTALIFEKEADRLPEEGYIKYLPYILYQQGVIYLKKDTVTAMSNFRESVKFGIELSNLSALKSYYELTKVLLLKITGIRVFIMDKKRLKHYIRLVLWRVLN